MNPMVQYPLGHPEGNRRWIVFLFAQLAPLVGHVARKIVPGNPVWTEGLSIIPVVFIGLWALQGRERCPGWITRPLVLLAALMLAWTVKGLIEAPLVALSEIPFRIGPMLMTPVAYATIRSEEDMSKVSNIFGVLALLLAPISIYVAVFGDSSLPQLLRPTAYHEAAGLTRLKDQYLTACALFSTPSQLGYFGLVVFGWSIVVFSTPRLKSRQFTLVAMVAGFIILYLSGRRIFTYIATILFMSNLLSSRAHVFRWVVAGLLVLAAVLWIDRRSEYLIPTHGTRISYLLQPDRSGTTFTGSAEGRFDRIVVRSGISNLLRYPLGTYLGKFSATGRALGENDILAQNADNPEAHISIESGLNLLIVEMGFVGAIAWPLAVLYIIYQLLRRSRHARSRHSVVVLLLFFSLLAFNYLLKDNNSLHGHQVQALFFWALPGLCAALLEKGSSQPRNQQPKLPNTQPVAVLNSSPSYGPRPSSARTLQPGVRRVP
jgi:hypothetical protein